MEFLKEHLGDELYNQVSEKLKGTKVKLADLGTGNYVDSQKFKAQEDKNTELSKQLDAANNQINEFKGMDIEAIKTAALEWETKYNEQKADYEKRESDRLFNDGLDKVLSSDKYNVKDLVGFKAHLDLTKISRDGENFIGLDEQVKAKGESLSHMINVPETEQPPTFTQQHKTTTPSGDAMSFNFTGVRPKPE